MAEVDLTPNEGMAAEAEKGLAWLEAGEGGDGIVAGTITDARRMVNRDPLSEDKVRRMVAWFARHEVDLQAPENDPDNENYPGPGRVAWALWGGDPGRTWAERKVSQMDAEADERAKRDGEEHDELVAQIAAHLEGARLALEAMANMDDAGEEEAPEGETPTAAPAEGAPGEPEGRSKAQLEVARRNGPQVELRTSEGTIRSVTVPERREMVAPMGVVEDPDAPAAEGERGGAPMFRGHAAVFDSESEDLGGFVETIARGAFRRALADEPDVRALFNHDSNYVLGRTTNGTLRLGEDPRGLVAEFEAPDTQYARDLRELVKRGDVNQMSFAFTVARDDWRERPDGTIHRRVLEVDRLYDVSLVTTPAYPETSAESVRETTVAPESRPEPPAEGVAGADQVADEAREARQRELLAGAKRRLALANAKQRLKG